MNIIFFAHFAGSPKHGMVYGHYYLAQEWIKMGHTVTIVAASYAHTRFAQPEQTGHLATEDLDGIRYVWIPVPAYDPKSGLGRARNILTFSFRCRFGKLPVEKAGLVICSSHHPFPIYASRRYSRKYNARLVFEVRDLWPLTLIELGGLSRLNPFIALMQRAEDYAYKHAGFVVSVLPKARDYMISRGLEPGKFVYIPNGANLTAPIQTQSLPDSHIQQLEKLRSEGKFILGYAGKIGLSNALHTLLEALTLCRDTQIAVALLGSGAFVEDLKIQASQLGLSERIVFLEPVSKDQVPDFLSRIDASYIGVQKSPLFRFGMSPTKLNDFMLAGKPLIYAIDAPDNVVEESGAGLSCDAEHPEQLCQAMLMLKNLSRERRDEMGARGRSWVIANRDYRMLAQRFLDAVMA
ncbi:MAG TPA: glycosyltransferase family 4 protein [Saprospiraceae bacterium]|nr:glycosyltransferase family 4 protein [Saprospiraceae bacterium]